MAMSKDNCTEDLFAQIHHDDMTETLYADITASLGPPPSKLDADQYSLNSVSEWTDEQVQVEKARLKELVNANINIFRIAYEAKHYANEDFWRAINVMKEAYTSCRESPPNVRRQLQEQIVDELVNSEILPTLSLILDEQLREGFAYFKDTKKIDHQLCRVACSTLAFFFYFADTSIRFSRIVTDDSCTLLTCIKFLLDRYMVSHFLKNLNPGQMADIEEMVFTALALSYNLVMHDDSETIRRIQESKLMESLRPYLFSNVDRCKVLTLLFMVYVANESDAKYYCNNPLVIKYLLDKLDEATKSERKSASGYSARELMRALEKLAAQDINKPLLEEIGTVSVMKELLIRGTLEEIAGSLQILMQLAFDVDVAKVIHNEVYELIERQLFDHDDPVIQKAARGLTWVLAEKKAGPEDDDESDHLSIRCRSLRRIRSRSPNQDQMGDASVAITVDHEPHIMISYNWDHQEKVRKIRDYLVENKFKVWYDEDKMGPNLLDSMAEAVEKAWVVIICLSRKYQLSQNTRLEAEYASKRGKRIIPVKMEVYDPDGWLGLLIGQKFFYDFSGEENSNSLFQLFSALKRLKEGNQDTLITTAQTVTDNFFEDATIIQANQFSLLNQQRDLSYLDHWNESVVKEWFTNNNIDSQPLGPTAGKELQMFILMMRRAPDAFFRYFLKKLTLREVASLVKALERL